VQTRSGVLLLLLALIVCTPQVGSAQPERGQHPTFGLGVSANAVPVVPSVTDSINIPIGLTAPITFFDVRLEPQLGFVRLNRSASEQSQTTRLISFGIGAFYLFRFDGLLLEPGLRVGFTRVDRTIERTGSSASDFTVDMFLGPAVGAEYYVSDSFSVGVEARLLYISVGQPQQAPPDRSASVLQTNGAAFLRFHF